MHSAQAAPAQHQIPEDDGEPQVEAQTYPCHICRPVICRLQPPLPPVQGVASHMHRPMSPM